LITSSTGSTSKNTGALQVVGGVGVGGNLNVGGFSNFVSDSSFNGNLLITSSTGSTSKNTGALQVVGGVGIGGNLNVGGFSNFVLDSSFNGNLLITSSTGSTSKNTGALQVVGGVGIGGNLNVGGFTILQSSSQGGNTLIISDSTNPGNKLNIIGNSSVSGISKLGDVGLIYGPTTGTNTQALVIAPSLTTQPLGMRLCGNGYIGIGKSYPQYILDVSGSLNATSITIGGTQINTSSQWNSSGSNIYYSTGNVSIGTQSNYSSTLNVSGNIYSSSGSSTVGGVVLSGGAITTSSINGVTIATSGISNVSNFNGVTISPINGINTISSVGNLISTSALNLTSATGTKINFLAGGYQSIYNGSYSNLGVMSAYSFNASSDYRIKNNVKNITDDFSIDKLRPVHYDMSGGEMHDMGFLAHEVQEIFPFLVSGEKDGIEMQKMNYNGFIALLVKEVQDLKKENIDLKSRLDAIEKRFM